MDPGKVVHNIQKLLSCCGGLVAVDEEDLTVQFVHTSARQHLILADVTAIQLPISSQRKKQTGL